MCPEALGGAGVCCCFRTLSARHRLTACRALLESWGLWGVTPGLRRFMLLNRFVPPSVHVHSLPPSVPHSPPGHREEPYLTEAGRAAFDRSCRLCQAGLQVLGGGLLQAPQPVLVKECELVKDALNILIGVVSATFSLCQVRTCSHVTHLGAGWEGDGSGHGVQGGVWSGSPLDRLPGDCLFVSVLKSINSLTSF